MAGYIDKIASQARGGGESEGKGEAEPKPKGFGDVKSRMVNELASILGVDRGARADFGDCLDKLIRSYLKDDGEISVEVEPAGESEGDEGEGGE